MAVRTFIGWTDSSGNHVIKRRVATTETTAIFGQNTAGIDVKMHGTTSGAQVLWDNSADLLELTKANIKMKDDTKIGFGDDNDVTLEWDTAATPDEFQIAAAADDTVISVGIAAATQKSFDVKIFGDAANGADYLLWDASGSVLTTAGAAYISGRADDTNGIGIALGTKSTSGAPGTTGTPTGSVVFNTNDKKLYAFDGSSWKSVTLS